MALAHSIREWQGFQLNVKTYYFIDVDPTAPKAKPLLASSDNI